jgi:hypothetical protein
VTPLTVFIGYDLREPEAYAVAEHSLRSRASVPVNVVPLKLGEPPVSSWLDRPIERRGGQMWCPISAAPMATEFAISRFGVVWSESVTGEGWSLFCDCDVLFRADVAELFALADDRFAVMCVKHEQKVEVGAVKMDGQQQTSYGRKNWSSVMLVNADHPGNRRLTHRMLNTLPGRDLHRFCWLADDEIGALPGEWNHLVGVNDAAGMEGAKLLHLTLGGPWFDGWASGPADALWLAERDAMQLASEQRKAG